MTEVVSTRLPPLERARRYREFARETLRLAELAARPDLKATYLSLTACWTSLAREAENAASRAAVERHANG
ncbi:MAG TPA: hypothetical protein VMF67_10625 [Rhizomicrobium sp.]|nr:hypothetical protein [Rhizomicrobium sp.]